jgi:hypothetical protein
MLPRTSLSGLAKSRRRSSNPMSHRAQTKVGDGDAGIARFELAQRRRRHAQPGGEILCHLPADRAWPT